MDGDTVKLNALEQLEVLKIVYAKEENMLEVLKNLEKIYNKIEDNKPYTEYMKNINIKYDKEYSYIYKIDFFEAEDVNKPEFAGNDFYFDIFKNWLIALNGVKKYLQENEQISIEKKKELNMLSFNTKKELLKAIEINKKRVKDDPLSLLFGYNYEKDEQEEFSGDFDLI